MYVWLLCGAPNGLNRVHRQRLGLATFLDGILETTGRAFGVDVNGKAWVMGGCDTHGGWMALETVVRDALKAGKKAVVLTTRAPFPSRWRPFRP